MTRHLLAIILQLETLDGSVRYEKRVTDPAKFRTMATLAGAVIASEWTVDDDARECIREWFTRREGDATLTVQCMRAPTVVDWTIRNDKQRKAVG
jgi:hypothetical protein